MKDDSSNKGLKSVSSDAAPTPISPEEAPAGSSLPQISGSNEDFFTTDHLLPNLSGRAISSAFITATSQAVQFVMTVVSTMILARLLSPHDFGLLAMVWAILNFLWVFKEAGLSTATVQREGITHAQVSNLFWINIGVSGFVSLLMAAAAPAIAWFYREPRLVGLTAALSATFLLAGLVAQHTALLNRQMRFKAIATIQITSTLVGIVVGISMAWLGYGYWSLVGMNLTTGFVTLLMTWFASRWRPQFFKRGSGTRPLLHFGANMTVGAFVLSLARGLDGVLIGRFYGPFSVGLYSRAAAMLNRPLIQFFCPMETVLVPVFSRLQNQPDRYRSTFLLIYESIALFSMLFTGMFFSMSHPLTLVLLGPKWEQAAIIFAGFTFAALQYPLTTSAGWLLATQGRGRDSMVANLIVSMVMAASFVVGLPYGPVGVAFAYSIACLGLQMPILYWLIGRSGPVKTADLWFGFLKYLPVWGVVAFVTWLVRLPIPDDRPLTELLFAAPIALLAGTAFIAVYPPARGTSLWLLAALESFLQSKDSSKFPFSILDLAFKTGPVAWFVKRHGKTQNTEKTMKTSKSDHNGTQTVVDFHSRPKADENFGPPPIRISALIPVYNRERTIARAIESVLNQEFPPAEIIVVDDGSNDRTGDIAASFGEKVRLVRQTNGGVSAARNRCVRESACDWLAFLDSDDYWLPSHLRRISDAIRATDAQAAIYFSDLKCLQQDGMQSFWQKCGLHVSAPHELKLDGAEWVFMPTQPIMFQASVIKRDYYNECGGLPEEMRTREDTLLFFELGLMYPLCAVSGCGTVLMDDGGDRLTMTMGEWSIEYARASVLIYENLAQMRGFVRGRRKLMIARSLSTAHFAMARANFRQKLYGSCFQSILQSGVTSPQICFKSAMESLKQTSPWLGSARTIRTVNASLETKK